MTNTTNRPALNRRALLHRALAGAAGAAIAVPAAASLSAGGIDPVIAMIAEEERLRGNGDALDAQLMKLMQAQPHCYDPHAPGETLPEPMASLHREAERWYDASEELGMRIEAMTPTTIEGAAAMLRWTSAADSPVIENVIAYLSGRGAAA
jgi:hypothetical protein